MHTYKYTHRNNFKILDVCWPYPGRCHEMFKSICLCIKYYVFVVLEMHWYMVKTICHSTIKHCMSLIMILAAAVLVNHSTRTWVQSQHKTILADLNRYTAKTLCLLIILTDDAINYTC